MPISADVLLERMKLKKQLHLWRGLAILITMFFAWVIMGEPIEDIAQTDYIARVRIEGFIMEKPQEIETLKALEEDKRVKAVIVHVDSPGGTVVGGESYHDAITDLKTQKPVVAVMGTLATSAAYMSVVNADRIFARRGTLTGSIGVLLESADFVDLAKKLGVDLTVIKSSPLKGTPSPLEKTTPEVEQALRVVINDFYDMFVDMVAAGRKLPRTEVVRLADGRVYTGPQALAGKLVDALGDEKDAIAWLETSKGVAKELKVKDVPLTPPKKGLESLMESFSGAKILDFSRFSTQGLLSVW